MRKSAVNSQYYYYRLIEVTRIVDGDTLDARIDLGFGMSAHFRFRLYGVDTPEIYGSHASKEGEVARQFVQDWFEQNRDEEIVVKTWKHSEGSAGIGDGAFGRWGAEFQFVDSQGDKQNLNQILLEMYPNE